MKKERQKRSPQYKSDSIKDYGMLRSAKWIVDLEMIVFLYFLIFVFCNESPPDFSFQLHTGVCVAIGRYQAEITVCITGT